MTSIDKFSRIAALRPLRAPLARPSSAPSELPRLSDSLPQSDSECPLADLLGAIVSRTTYGQHLTVRNWHSTPEFCQPAPGVIHLLTRPTAKRNAPPPVSTLAEDPEKWLFLDTETTGLAGGTGTYAFLVGIAWWDAGGLQVEQFMMRDFSEEHSVLCELAARIAERPVLVTFNGKSFDWPLLESRYQMTRSIRVPQLAAHLDLLHPARAVWKLRLGSVRLIELERKVLDLPDLGWHRDNDVPSALIPQFYFDYLRGSSPAPLAGVVRHNRMDLRGLAALFGKLNSLLETRSHSHTRGELEALDLFGLSRYLQRRGEPARAESACVAAVDRGLPLPFDAQAQRELALMAKRNGRHDQAAKLWESLLDDGQFAALACEELAIHHERRTGNYQRALDFALQALKLTRSQSFSVNSRLAVQGASALRLRSRLQKRIARLEKRLVRDQSSVTLAFASSRTKSLAAR